MNPWFVASSGLLSVWIIIWIVRQNLRKEMLWASVLTMPLGLLEPLFVPEYWNPPSLFDLALKTGFDIESLIFAFAVGGIGSVLYEFLTREKHKKIRRYRKDSRKYRLHLLSLTVPIVIFILLVTFIDFNPIYSAVIAMLIGAVEVMICRPDLKNRILLGGVSFFILYFLFFLLFNLIYPGSVSEVWNLSAISGILILDVPIEELLFAFTFGMLWSTYYEHINWYK